LYAKVVCPINDSLTVELSRYMFTEDLLRLIGGGIYTLSLRNGFLLVFNSGYYVGTLRHGDNFGVSASNAICFFNGFFRV